MSRRSSHHDRHKRKQHASGGAAGEGVHDLRQLEPRDQPQQITLADQKNISEYNDDNSQSGKRETVFPNAPTASLASASAGIEAISDEAKSVEVSNAEEFTLTPTKAFTKSVAEPADVKATLLTGPSIKEPDMTLRDPSPSLHVVPPAKASSSPSTAPPLLNSSADMREKPFNFGSGYSAAASSASSSSTSSPSSSMSGMPPGALLKAARERAGMSVGDIATRLRMSVRQVEAIDTDHYEALPKGPFLRGFMRNYAKVVNVDVNEILALLDRTELGASTAQKPAMIDLPNQNIKLTAGNLAKPGSKVRLLVTIAVLLALIAAASYWWTFVKPNLATGGRPVPVAVLLSSAAMENGNAASAGSAITSSSPGSPVASSDGPSGSVATPPAGAGPPAEALSIALPGTPSNQSAGATSALAQPALQPAPQAATQTATVTPTSFRPPQETTVETPLNTSPSISRLTPSLSTSAADAAEAEKAAAVPKGSSRVGFTFTGRSWVEVIDGRGKTVLSKRYEAGESDEAVGRPPFSIVVGNADVTRMAYNGKAFDLAPHTRVSVARVTIK
jgi:cytoskeleton protein RodZ